MKNYRIFRKGNMNIRTSRLVAGFSLVEVMVAMVIGLITVLVIGQVMQVGEVRRRSITGGSDSTVNASLALYGIERDGKNAGFGMGILARSLGCHVQGFYSGTVLSWRLTPVMITDGASGAPDSVRFIASAKNGNAMPMEVDRSYTDHFQTRSLFGVAINDMLIGVPHPETNLAVAGNDCTLFQVTAIDNTDPEEGKIYFANTSDWNDNVHARFSPEVKKGGSYLINLGSFIDRTYQISATSRCE